MRGRPMSGSAGFAVLTVSGRNRLPKPAARTMAFLSRKLMMLVTRSPGTP